MYNGNDDVQCKCYFLLFSNKYKSVHGRNVLMYVILLNERNLPTTAVIRKHM